MASAPPDPPSPMTRLTMGGLQTRHHQQIAGNGFALAAFLGTHARVGARRVDEGEQRQAKLLGHAHQAQCLAVALRARHAVVASDALFGVPALLMPQHHDRLSFQPGQPPHERRIVRVHPIPVQLQEVREASPGCSPGCRGVADDGPAVRSAMTRGPRRCRASATRSCAAAARSPRRYSARSHRRRISARRSSPRVPRWAARNRETSGPFAGPYPQGRNTDK